MTVKIEELHLFELQFAKGNFDFPGLDERTV